MGRPEPLVFFSAIWYLVVTITPSTGQNISVTNNLFLKLTGELNKNTLPKNDRSEKIAIDASFTLLALGDLDEVSQKLSTVFGIKLHWLDENMIWNPLVNENISNITVDATTVWKPYLVVKNKHHTRASIIRNKEAQKIIYSFTGLAEWEFTATIDTKCHLDTTYFPFDIQKCKITMLVSGYDEYVEMNPRFENDENTNEENGAWTITSSDIIGSYGFVNIEYELSRKPLFLLVNILLPIVVLGFLAPLVFLLPNGTGERIGYSITTLLAISVYMIIIGDNLPKHANPLPIFSMMLFVWYTINTSVVFIVVINTKLLGFDDDDRLVPNIIQFVVKFIMCAYLKRWRAKRKTNQQIASQLPETTKRDSYFRNGLERNDYEGESDVTLLPELNAVNDLAHNRDRRVAGNNNKSMKWEHVCKAVDFTFMIAIYVTKIFYIGTVLIILKYQPWPVHELKHDNF